MIRYVIALGACMLLSPTAAAKDAATYAWATSSDRIRTNPAYVERVLGPPETKYPGSWTFNVDGCRVEYVFEDDSISRLNAQISRSCHINVRGVNVTNTTTFGQIGRALGGSLTASCLESCGNAADPTISLLIRGTRATGFIDVLFYGVYTPGQSRAMDLWSNAIRRKLGMAQGGMGDNGMNCVANAPASVANAMQNEQFDSVTIGLDANYYCDSN